MYLFVKSLLNYEFEGMSAETLSEQVLSAFVNNRESQSADVDAALVKIFVAGAVYILYQHFC